MPAIHAQNASSAAGERCNSSSATRANAGGLRPMSLRRNFSWTLLGNLGHAACQIGLLLVLAKLASPAHVGQFALGIAITAPVFMLSMMGLRNVQATDSLREFCFGDYMGLRCLSNVLALGGVLGAVVWMGCRPETLYVVLLVAVAKAVEAVSDVHYGLFQQRERMELIAQSKLAQGVLAICAMSASVHFTQSLVVGVCGFVFSYVVVFAAFDRPNARRLLHSTSDAEARRRWRPDRRQLWKLAWLGLPLAGTSLLMSLHKNIPRYFIAHFLDEHRLGIFSVLAGLMMAGTTVSRALNLSVTARLGRYYNAGQRREFVALLVKLSAVYLVCGVLGVAAVAVFGERVLAACLDAEYARHTGVLVFVMIAAGITYLVSLIDIALVSARCTWPMLIKMCIATATVAAASASLVPTHGLRGAAMALALGKLPGLVLGLAILYRVLQSEDQTRPW